MRSRLRAALACLKTPAHSSSRRAAARTSRRLTKILAPAWSDRRGQSVVLFAIMLPLLFGVAAIVVDIAHMYVERRELQNAVDGAALAGARELPADETEALSRALVWADHNGVPGSEVSNVVFGTTCSGDTLTNSITVRAERSVSFWFAPV